MSVIDWESVCGFLNLSPSLSLPVYYITLDPLYLIKGVSGKSQIGRVHSLYLSLRAMLLLFVIQIIHYSNPFCFLPIHRHGCPHLRATSFLRRHFSVWEPELEAFPDFDASTLTVAWRSNSASPSPLEWRNWRTKRSDFWCVNLSGLAHPKKKQNYVILFFIGVSSMMSYGV